MLVKKATAEILVHVCSKVPEGFLLNILNDVPSA